MMRALSLVSALSLITIVGCKSSNPNDKDAGVDIGAQTPDDLAGGPDLSTDDIGVTEPDGGTPPPPGDGGVGYVSCGSMPCDVMSNVCCETTMMNKVVADCEPKAQCTNGIIRSCDGPEDCSNNDVCCIGAAGATTCDTKCMGAQPEACHDKSECPTPAQAGHTAACCPLSATLSECRDFANGMMIPKDCN